MKLQCAILDDYQNVALKLADWEKIAHQVEVHPFQRHFEPDELVRVLQDYDIVVIMRERTAFSTDIFNRLPRLKLLVTSGMRNASIDLAAAEKHGVTVCGTESFPEPPVELTWALILGLARHLTQEALALRNNGSWQSALGEDLYGKQLGILGLGKIGVRVAKVAQAFGMKVVAWSQNLTQAKADAEGVILTESKESLLRESDIVSIHTVLSERTKNLIGKNEIAQMKKTAYLINTSRANIVNQQALIQALENHEIAGAGIDVFDIEPLPALHPFRTLPNILATPHLGYVTHRNYTTYFGEAVEDIEAFLAGKPIRELA
jgi:phosphoglycerate dehydrogenase-like enzyme